MWCDVMWCDVMWCDVLWCDVMWGWCEGDVRVMWGWCDVMWCDSSESSESSKSSASVGRLSSYFRKTWPAAAWLPPFLPVSPPCSPSQAAPPASVRSRQPWLERARWIILLFNASNVCAPQPIWEWPNQSVASEGSQTGRPRPGRMVCWSTLWPGITHVLHDT